MIIDKDNIKILLIILILGLGIGYAYINSDLNINGTAQVNHANWDVHWANVQVTNGSVSASSPTISNQTTVNYSVILNLPGDYYEFTVDAVNGGSIDAMVDTIDSKLNGATITNLPDYLRYTVTYSSGIPLATNQLLAANTTEKYKLRIEYRDDIELNQIPATNQNLILQFTVKYRQATNSATVVDHSFANQSWETIINNVRSGNIDNYNVGDTKTVDMGTFGTHTLRIANKSTPVECLTTGFSQTACGFVLEFADIITNHVMNSTDTNAGGWPASEMRTYVNSDIYNALPTDLKNGIINTTVVSGSDSLVPTNFISIDKLYLLSGHEVHEDVDGNETGGLNKNDAAYSETRQLDYYFGQGVTTSDFLVEATKKEVEINASVYWWLRSSISYTSNSFCVVSKYGGPGSNPSSRERGVSPAFRIG